MNSDDSRSNNGSNNPVCIPNNLNHNLNSNSNCNPPEIDQNISTTTMLLNIVNNYHEFYNTEVKYRYQYVTSLYNISNADLVSVELLTEVGITESDKCYKFLINSPRFYKLTQIQPTEFVELYKVLKELIDTTPVISYDLDNKSDEIAEISVNTRKRKLGSADRLFVWLLELDGVNAELLAEIFDCSASTIRNNTKFITDIILNELEDEIEWPDEIERKQLRGLFPVSDKAIAVIDGTHCEIKIPFNMEQEISYFSGYKHKHTQLYMVVIDIYGFFRMIEGPWPGQYNDRSAFIEMDIYKNSSKYFSDGEVMLADGGFGGDGPILYPFNAVALNADASEKDSMKSFNQVLTDSRALVEHAIHRLKSRATALTHRYPKNKDQQFRTLKAAAILYNWTRRYRIKKQI